MKYISNTIINNNNNNMTFILRPKMQANSKAHAFVASTGLSEKKMGLQQTLKATMGQRAIMELGG